MGALLIAAGLSFSSIAAATVPETGPTLTPSATGLSFSSIAAATVPETGLGAGPEAPLSVPAGVITAPAPPENSGGPDDPSGPGPVITSPSGGYFSGNGTVPLVGLAPASSSIAVLVGGKTVGRTSANASGEFRVTATGLESGTNVAITVRARTPGGAEVTSPPLGVNVLTAPVITPQPEGVHTGLIRGTGFPGATVTLTLAGAGTWTTPVQSSGRWAYSVPTSLHGTFQASAQQSSDFSAGALSSRSGTVPVTIDNRPPPAPKILHPRAGETVPLTSTFSGTGENGATVTVYTTMNSGHSGVLCTATVDGTTWSCEVTVEAAGAAAISAYQTDSSGNPGTGTAPLKITFASATSPSPSPEPSSSPEPSVPAPTDEHSPAPAPSTALPAPPRSIAPPWNWTAPTPFSLVQIASPHSDGAWPWILAFTVAVGAIGLIVVPARLLAGTLGTGKKWRFTGRNSVRAREEDNLPSLSERVPWLVSALSILFLALVVVLAMPLGATFGANLRLYLVTLAVLLLVNGASVALPLLLPGHVPVAARTVEIAPRYLLAAVAASVLSRIAELSPALIFALAVAVVLVEPVSRVARGRAGLLRIAGVFVLGVLGWVGSSYAAIAVADQQSFLHVVWAELSSVTAMAGIGSAAILLVPLGRTSGRAILAWSPLVWLGTAIVIYTALCALILPGIVSRLEPGVIAGLTIAALFFAGISIAISLWRRVISPLLWPATPARHGA